MVDNEKLLRERPDEPDRRLPVCRPKLLHPFPLLREKIADDATSQKNEAARQLKGVALPVRKNNALMLRDIFQSLRVTSKKNDEDQKSSVSMESQVTKRHEGRASESRNTIAAGAEKNDAKKGSKEDKARERKRKKQVRKRMNRKNRERNIQNRDGLCRMKYWAIPGKTWVVHEKASRYTPEELHPWRWHFWTELPDDKENRYVARRV